MELVDDLKNDVSLSASQTVTVVPGDPGGGGGGGSGGLRDWQIALSVILPVLLIVCLAALILGLCYQRRRRENKNRPHNNQNNQSRYQEKPGHGLPYTDIAFSEPAASTNSVVIVTEETDSEEDVARVFSEEGDLDRPGSLSSLSSILTQSDAQSIREVIAGLGDKFQALAQIYKEDDEDSELDNNTSYNGTVHHNLGHESWV